MERIALVQEEEYFLFNKKGRNLGRDGSQFVDMAVVI